MPEKCRDLIAYFILDWFSTTTSQRVSQSPGVLARAPPGRPPTPQSLSILSFLCPSCNSHLWVSGLPSLVSSLSCYFLSPGLGEAPASMLLCTEHFVNEALPLDVSICVCPAGNNIVLHHCSHHHPPSTHHPSTIHLSIHHLPSIHHSSTILEMDPN